MIKRPLAAVTMVHNEPDFLSVWFRYYSGQVGAENCFIMDHGSTDRSIDAVQGNKIWLPRNSHSNVDRAAQVSKFCSFLLTSYDRVLYSDVDEMVVADPSLYTGLLEYSLKAPDNIITAVGMDVVEDVGREARIDLSQAILKQRKWARPLGFLCKPVLIHREVKWWSGFHNYDGPSVFSDLYLFHVALCDMELVKKRQISRNKAAPNDGGNHHNIDPETFSLHVRNIALGTERQSGIEFSQHSSSREEFISTLFDPDADRGGQQIKNHAVAGKLWQIPERFQNVF